MAVALAQPFAVCRGIEILESLHQFAIELKEKYTVYASQQETRLPEVEFIKGSIFEVDWSDASVIFANSTCFGYEHIVQISQIPCKPGTFAISMTRPLLHSHWQVLESLNKPTSWGYAKIFIQRKLSPGQELE